MRARRGLAVCAGAALLAPAGCGGASAPTAGAGYADALNGAQRSFAGSVGSLAGAGAPSASPGARVRAAASLDTALADTVAQLRAIEPPARVASLHRELLGELVVLHAQVAAARPGLRASRRAAAAAAGRHLAAQARASARAIDLTLGRIARRLGQ